MTVTRTIDAPIDVVFRAISEIDRFSVAVPQIVNVEVLSENRSGVGTRFVETRTMGKREVSNELEITEHVENERVRYVADSHGTVWDTVFTVAEKDGKTEMSMRMDANAYKLLPKIMNFMIAGMIRKAVEGDMDAVKEYCEKS